MAEKKGLAARTFGAVPSPSAVLARARDIAENCNDPKSLKATRDQVKHIAEWYSERGAKLEEQNKIAEGRLRLERKMGTVLPSVIREGNPQLSNDTTVVLRDLQISRDQSSIWQKIARLAEDLFEDRIAEAKENSLELTTTYVLHGPSRATKANWSSESVEWYTPEEYVEAARAVLGTIDLDPASCAKANETVKATKFYTRKDDGLSKPWAGRVWLNPPYGEDGTGQWVDKLVLEHQDGRTTAAILLVNAVTDRKWFAPLFDHVICFTNHRIKFYVTDDVPDSPPSGNALVYFGKERKKFQEHFEQFGPCVVRL
jgi:ParB family chromosome partitioning protein